MSTNEYIRNVKNNHWPRFDGKLWQRNYWEHIIRDEKSYLTISEYIINNPKNWGDDSINPKKEKNSRISKNLSIVLKIFYYDASQNSH